MTGSARIVRGNALALPLGDSIVDPNRVRELLDPYTTTAGATRSAARLPLRTVMRIYLSRSPNQPWAALDKEEARGWLWAMLRAVNPPLRAGGAVLSGYRPTPHRETSTPPPLTGSPNMPDSGA